MWLIILSIGLINTDFYIVMTSAFCGLMIGTWYPRLEVRRTIMQECRDALAEEPENMKIHSDIYFTEKELYDTNN